MVNLTPSIKVSQAIQYSTSRAEFELRAVAEGLRKTTTASVSEKANTFIPIRKVLTREQTATTKSQPKKFFSFRGLFKKRERTKRVKRDIDFASMGLL